MCWTCLGMLIMLRNIVGFRLTGWSSVCHEDGVRFFNLGVQGLQGLQSYSSYIWNQTVSVVNNITWSCSSTNAHGRQQKVKKYLGMRLGCKHARYSGPARLHVELKSENSRHLYTSILTSTYYNGKHVARPQVSMQCEAQCRCILLVLLYELPKRDKYVDNMHTIQFGVVSIIIYIPWQAT